MAAKIGGASGLSNLWTHGALKAAGTGLTGTRRQ
jgi:hypothetical protein